jgi:hypothetical protein
MESVPFSELLRQPVETAERLTHTRAVRLRRRDAEDLVLMSADRAEAESEVFDLTGRLLVNVLKREPHLLHEVLPTVLPWARFLPATDIDLLATELTATAEAAAAIGNMAPLSQLLTEWRHTAEIYADPDLHRALTNRNLGDYGPVPKPDGE